MKNKLKVAMGLVVMVVLSLAVVAQEKRSTLDRPQLKPVSGGEPFSLSKLDIQVRINGGIAETRLTMTFWNSHDRALASDFVFPLPDGAVVSGYALDVNGMMVDGVVVEREKARVAFETEMRRRVDPGLVEWVKGNCFRTRIFPVPGRGSRTIMVRYISDLTHREGHFIYRLPVSFQDMVPQFSFRMEVAGRTLPPIWMQGLRSIIPFVTWQEAFVADIKMQQATLDNDILVALPEEPARTSWLEKTSDGFFYFLIADRLEVASQPAVKKSIDRVTLFWDASASRFGNHEREKEVLRLFFAQHREDDVWVDLVILRHRAQPAGEFFIYKGECSHLLNAIGALEYDGGTQLGDIKPDCRWANADLYLLFSDGFSNFDAREPAPLPVPLFAFSDSSEADHILLRHLARQSGGEFFDLKTCDPEDAALEIEKIPRRVLKVEVSPAGSAEVIVENAILPNGEVRLVGKLLLPSAGLRVIFNHGKAGEEIKEFCLRQEQARPGDLLRLYWAKQQINKLLIHSRKNRQVLLEVGKKFGLVTPDTSLLVLENLGQYLEHEVMPPPCLPEMQKEYQMVMAKKAKNETRQKGEKIERVIKMWQERVSWWKKVFVYPAYFSYIEYQAKKRALSGQDWLPANNNDSTSGVIRLNAVMGGIEGGVYGGVSAGVEDSDEIPSVLALSEVEPKMPLEPANGLENLRTKVVLLEWDPDMHYLRMLKKRKGSSAEVAYMSLRRHYLNCPDFFLDCADFFFRRGDRCFGLQVLSNLAELELEDPTLLRILASRLDQLGLHVLAECFYTEVLRLRPEEPQSYRDLGLIKAALGKYGEALKLLGRVVTGEWNRFEGIEAITLMEINALIPRARKAGLRRIPIDPRLIHLLDADLRIVVDWDRDTTDIDLHVIEPSQEEASYYHNLTIIGGLLSDDFTDGYGPEEYVIKRAMKGTYSIRVHFYGSHGVDRERPITLRVSIYTQYGRPGEKKRSLTLRLDHEGDVYRVGTVTID